MGRRAWMSLLGPSLLQEFLDLAHGVTFGLGALSLSSPQGGVALGVTAPDLETAVLRASEQMVAKTGRELARGPVAGGAALHSWLR